MIPTQTGNVLKNISGRNLEVMTAQVTRDDKEPHAHSISESWKQSVSVLETR
ncbi:hypothetical protein Mapa_005809 [Marchantia paleacea]|nr:hypothetical protein Mapa_005809 [Marchantia paleacea]